MLGYLVDSTGVITDFLGEFRRLAARSGGEIEPDKLLGKPLFSFVQGYELKQALRQLLQRPDREKKVRLHRSDTPERLRLWQLSVDYTGRATRLWFEQVAQRDRPFLPHLDPFPDPICHCSWCNSVQNSSGTYCWLNLTDSYRLANQIRRQPESVHHLLCPACSAFLRDPERPGASLHLTHDFAARTEPARTRPA